MHSGNGNKQRNQQLINQMDKQMNIQMNNQMDNQRNNQADHLMDNPTENLRNRQANHQIDNQTNNHNTNMIDNQTNNYDTNMIDNQTNNYDTNMIDNQTDNRNTYPMDNQTNTKNNRQTNIETNIQSTTMNSRRRKRVNRLKVVIVTILLLMMILPTLICIYLGYQVSLLQNQVNELLTMHGREEIDYVIGLNESYVYAAERESKEAEELFEHWTSKSIDNTTEGKANEEKVDSQPEAQSEAQIDTQIDNQAPNKAADEDKAISAGQEDKIYAGKKVYLTFDDGPSIYTDQILDTLAEHQVKATFFVTGKKDKESLRRYQRIVEEGHTLGMHSYSHVYDKIYNSIEDFDKDFTKLWKLLYDTTGYIPTIYRFPGGSSNQVNKKGMTDFIQYLNEKSITYYDWNVDSGDATGRKYTKEELIENVLKGVSFKKISIVLMHDLETKETTADALSDLLTELIQGGAEILSLDEEVKPIQQIKFDSIK